MLRLQAEAVAEGVYLAALAFETPVEKVAGVELDAGLRRVDVHDAPGCLLGHADRLPQRACLPVQHEVVIVTLSELDLLVVRRDSGADGHRLPEIERATRNRPQFAGRDQGVVDG